MGIVAGIGAIATGVATAAGATATTAAVVGGVAAAGAGYAMSRSKKKGAQANAAALGSRPELPSYQPVDVPELSDVFRDSIRAIQENEGAIYGINDRANAEVARQDLKRVDRFVQPLMPEYRSSLGRLSSNTDEALAGRLPFDDALESVRRSSEFGNTIGVPGTYTNLTLRDLGRSRVDMMNLGAQWLGQETNIANTLSPIGRYGTPQQYFVMPGEAADFALKAAGIESGERQNTYQSGFNQANAAAMPDPVSQARYTEALYNRYNPSADYAAYKPAVDSILKQYNSFQANQQPATNWRAGTTANPYAAGTGGYNPVGGYRPRSIDYSPSYS